MNEEVRNKVTTIISRTPAANQSTITFNNGDDPVVGQVEQHFEGDVTVSIVDEYGRERFYDFDEAIIEDVVEN